METAGSRREFLTAAATVVGTGWLTTAGAHPSADTAVVPPPPVPMWSGEYWAQKGPVKLYLYRKRPKGPGRDCTVVFLVHGSSISARPSFDLTVPGAGEYSLMNVIARWGYDVWTMDHEGYGRSSRTTSNSDIASGAADLEAATEVVERETGRQTVHLFGTSSGALRAAAFAMARPDRVDRLVLAAFTWTGKGSPTLARRRQDVEFYRQNHRRPRDREMIRSIFTRDRPGTADPAVAEALADAELQFGDTVPTGPYLDMSANLPVVDPTRVMAPVLLVRGEHDGIATEEDVLEFYRRLPNADRQFVTLAGAAHSLGFDRNRHRLWHVMRAFLQMPSRLDSGEKGDKP